MKRKILCLGLIGEPDASDLLSLLVDSLMIF